MVGLIPSTAHRDNSNSNIYKGKKKVIINIYLYITSNMLKFMFWKLSIHFSVEQAYVCEDIDTQPSMWSIEWQNFCCIFLSLY